MGDEYLTGNAPMRTIQQGFFPSSIRPSRREGIFSEILTTALAAEPSLSYLELKEEFTEKPPSGLDKAVEPDDIVNIIDEKYGTAPQDDNSKEEDGILPFHPEIAANIKPPNTFQWGRWYEMFLTRPNGSLEEDVHRSFHQKLANIDNSNIFEELLRDYVSRVVDNGELVDTEQALEELIPRRCYIPSLAKQFQNDLRTWSNIDTIKGSQWLASVRDLVCYYCMSYIMQLSINIDEEWSEFLKGTSPDNWSPEIKGIPFGVRSETASNDRDFRNVWMGSPNLDSLYDQIYASWPRLAATKVLSDTLNELKEGKPHLFTLLEARAKLTTNDDWENEAVDELLSYVHESQYADRDVESLTEAARIFEKSIDMYYRGRSSSNTTAITAGPGAISQLGKSNERSFIDTRDGVGTILVLNEGSLSLLARTFDRTQRKRNENYSYKNFRRFLKDRGIKFDNRSQEAALETLESMGLIKQESDSGDSVNVRTH